MRHDIVIVGGGAGGLELAARLGRALGRTRGPASVLLVDREVFHIWKPTLHEVAVGTLDTHQEGLSYPILALRNHFAFTVGKLVGIDAPARTITLEARLDAEGRVLVPERTVAFGALVLALGSGSNFFGTPGAAEHCSVLEKATDAERFRQQLLAAYTRCAYAPADGATGRRAPLRVGIVGGGATGVELSAEMLESHQVALQTLGPQQHFELQITLIEAGPRVLGGLPERISAQARAALEAKGVHVRTGTQVQRVTDGLLHIAAPGEPERALPADLMVWAAGIQAAARNAGYGLAVNRLHQFEVDAMLRTSAPDIYAIGDCAACVWHHADERAGKRVVLVPARAQAAHQQAEYLRTRLLRRLRGAPEGDAPFVYRDFGSLVSLGENKGVGNLMGSLSGQNFFVEGLIAKWMYMSLHLMHHRAILGIRGTIVLALARLLQQRVSGRLKLH